MYRYSAAVVLVHSLSEKLLFYQTCTRLENIVNQGLFSLYFQLNLCNKQYFKRFVLH